MNPKSDYQYLSFTAVPPLSDGCLVAQNLFVSAARAKDLDKESITLTSWCMRMLRGWYIYNVPEVRLTIDELFTSISSVLPIEFEVKRWHLHLLLP